jgi:hypothetical protein
MPFIGNKPTAVPLTSADITDGIITSAKLANDAVVTGKIADGTITIADLSTTGTADATTFLRGDNTFAAAGGGKLEQIVISSAISSIGTTSTSFVNLSADLTVTITPTAASGIFTFPSTGYYLIIATYQFRKATGDRGIGGNILVTTNNSSYSIVSSVEVNNSDIGGADNTTYAGIHQTIIDVTDISNVKFKLTIQTSGISQTCDGNTGRNYTGFTCIRLGDT